MYTAASWRMRLNRALFFFFFPPQRRRGRGAIFLAHRVPFRREAGKSPNKKPAAPLEAPGA
jgi:hypothetical protein